MSLLDQINNDFITAYKGKEELKISVLRLLKSALKNEEIALKKPLSDDDVIKVVKRELKQRKDSSEEYRKNNQIEAAEKEESEALILNTYLPAQLDETAIKEIAREKIVQLGTSSMSDMGKVIGAIMAEHGGEADGATVSKVVRELLS